MPGCHRERHLDGKQRVAAVTTARGSLAGSADRQVTATGGERVPAATKYFFANP